MKNIIKSGILVLLICTGFTEDKSFFHEERNNVLVTDYRDPFVGFYFCTVSITGRQSQVLTDTLTLHITKDIADSILKITIGNITLKTKLVSSNLNAFPYGGKYKGSFYSSDSLRFIYSPTRSTLHSYKGKKQ
jgi:hypothetical protein